MMFIGLGLFVSISFCAYYYNFAKKTNRNKMVFAFIGLTLPFLPFLLFLLYISIGHLILGHDPEGRIGKKLFSYGMISYIALIFLLPQFLKSRWKKEVPIETIDKDILD